MGFRTVVIKSRAKLETKLNYLIVRAEKESKIFIDEINTLIIQSTAVAVTAALLSNDDISFLSKHCEAEKIGILLIESSKTRELLPNEKAITITEDLCEIVENHEEI